jgi:hypothetical protein
MKSRYPWRKLLHPAGKPRRRGQSP